MRKVIFTEEQMKHILGEDFNAYLSLDDGAKQPYNSYGTETCVGEKDEDGDTFDTTITDKISQEKDSMYPIWTRGTRMFPDVQTPLKEDNQDLENMSFNLGNNMNQDARRIAAANPNDRMMNNIAGDNGMSIHDAYMRKKRIGDMKEENPERYEKIQGDRMTRILQNQIDTAKKSSLRKKQAARNRGEENTFQKAGGTKEYGNGKAHTIKPKVAPPLNP